MRLCVIMLFAYCSWAETIFAYSRIPCLYRAMLWFFFYAGIINNLSSFYDLIIRVDITTKQIPYKCDKNLPRIIRKILTLSIFSEGGCHTVSTGPLSTQNSSSDTWPCLEGEQRLSSLYHEGQLPCANSHLRHQLFRRTVSPLKARGMCLSVRRHSVGPFPCNSISPCQKSLLLQICGSWPFSYTLFFKVRVICRCR